MESMEFPGIIHPIQKKMKSKPSAIVVGTITDPTTRSLSLPFPFVVEFPEVDEMGADVLVEEALVNLLELLVFSMTPDVDVLLAPLDVGAAAAPFSVLPNVIVKGVA